MHYTTDQIDNQLHIFRSLPVFFDFYETFYGIESFGIVMSILVRASDFAVVSDFIFNLFNL